MALSDRAMEPTDRVMEPTVPQSAHSALLGLERSTAPPAELLDEAARILNIDFDTLRRHLFSSPRDLSLTDFPVFAPKEEWALRWLLKKTGPPSTSPSSKSSLDPGANTDPRKWLLFYYLVPRVPVKRLAKLLRDHHGIGQIQHALYQLSNGPTTMTLPDPESERHLSAEDEPEETDYQDPPNSSRKRKRTSPPASPDDLHCPTLQIMFSILKILRLCFHYTQTHNTVEASAPNLLRMSFTLPPEMAAPALQSMFRCMLYVGGRIQDGMTNDILNLLRENLRLWEFRRRLELGHTDEESNQIFTTRLLHASLSMIEFLRQKNLQQRHAELVSQLEILVATHTTQPARKVFFDELVTNWKSSSNPLLVSHLKPAVDRLQNLLCPKRDDLSPGHKAESLGRLGQLLLEIAIRSSPRSTVIKTQHEQPWLEALSVCLAHIAGCSLIGHEKTVIEDEKEDRGNSVESPGETSLVHLETLLSTVIEWKTSLSLHILILLAQRFSGLAQHSPRWTLIEILMDLDINIFLPNGISTAGGLRSSLVESLDRWSRQPDFDRRAGTRVLFLLMQGFASARDLSGFVDIWMGRLVAAEDGRKPQAETLSYSLWEDEDVVARFAQNAKVHASPYFVESHLIATTEALRSEVYNGKHYALVVVLDSLITTHADDLRPVENTVKLLYAELEGALQTVKTLGVSNAWLWRLLRHVSPLAKPESPLRLFKSLRKKEPPIIETVIQHTSQVVSFAALERFHCLLTILESHVSDVGKYLDAEIQALTRFLDELATEEEKDDAPRMWDGRLANLESRPTKLMACLGILLQHSQILRLDIDLPVQVLKVLADLVTSEQDEDGQESSTGYSLLLEAILLDKGLTSTPGFAKTCIKATGLMDGDVSPKKLKLLQALPKDAISKWQRKQIAEWQRHRTVDGKVENMHKLSLVEVSLGSGSMTCSKFQSLCRGALAKCDSIEDLCETMNSQSSPKVADFIHLGRILYKAEASSSVTHIASNLLTLLPSSKSVEELCLNADCIRIILEKIPSSVNQWTVDHLLACVATTLSSQGPKIVDVAPIIFERLCRLVGALLSRHRIRLGGRYHLLIPVLQSLLRCLFAPDPRSLTTQSQVLFYSKFTPWIHSSKTKLPKSSAIHLTRLLTSICDPTPSSVRKRFKPTHNPLTDETKKARRIAGEYMQYFIAEYAYCQLNGRINPEAKQGLMPGLYAAIDAMGKKVMRAMNAAMDSNQRAIWKGLYDDWVRFGRWDGM